MPFRFMESHYLPLPFLSFSGQRNAIPSSLLNQEFSKGNDYILNKETVGVEIIAH